MPLAEIGGFFPWKGCSGDKEQRTSRGTVLSVLISTKLGMGEGTTACSCSQFPLNASGEMRCDGLFARVPVSPTAFTNYSDRRAERGRRLGETFLRSAPPPSLPGQVTCPGCPCPALPRPARPAPGAPGPSPAAAAPSPAAALRGSAGLSLLPGQPRSPQPGSLPVSCGGAVLPPPPSLPPFPPCLSKKAFFFFLLSGSVNQLHLKSRKCKSIASSSEPPATPCVSQTAELPVPFSLCGAARVSPCLRGKSRSGICSRSQRFLPRLL